MLFYYFIVLFIYINLYNCISFYVFFLFLFFILLFFFLLVDKNKLNKNDPKELNDRIEMERNEVTSKNGN